MKLIPTIAIFVVLVLAVFLGYHIDNTSPEHVSITRASAETAVKETTVEEPAPVVDPYPTLAADMNAAMVNSTGLSVSATLIDLDTGKEYDAGNYTQTYEGWNRLNSELEYYEQTVRLAQERKSFNTGLGATLWIA